MSRKKERDPIWDQVEEIQSERWRCKHCGNIYSGGAARIRDHVYGIPGRGVQACRFPITNPSASVVSGVFGSSEAKVTSTGKVSALDSTKYVTGSAAEEPLPHAGALRLRYPCNSTHNLPESQVYNRQTFVSSVPSGDAKEPLPSAGSSGLYYSSDSAENRLKSGVYLSQAFLSSIASRFFLLRLNKILLKAGISIDNDLDKTYYDGGQQAMKRCRILIPVISENYMSNERCLDELLNMSYVWKQKPEIVILPIFYGVKASDIIHSLVTSYSKIRYPGIESFKEAKEALKMVARMSGWAVSEPCSEEIMHLIAREVSSIIHPKIPHEGPYFVGIDRKVQQIMDLLNVEVNDKRAVAICGMGGVGKTTLAKVLYSRLSAFFEGCCFIPDIKETAQQSDRCFQDLQTKLISNILKRKCEEISSVDEGISYMRVVFCHMKVLIVLDDVDARFNLKDLVGELDTFGPGSRIIVTSRCASDHLGVDQTYEVPGLSQWEVRQLFFSYANAKYPPFDKLATEIISVIGVVPLVVEVIGSFLYGKGDTVWKETLKKLREISYEELQKRLMISYDALGVEHKQIFLDIACSINGEDKRIASYMWNDFNAPPFSRAREFCHFWSLIKIGDRGELWMHDELRELGRQLARQGGYKELHKEGRSCSTHADFGTFKRAEGKEKVGALNPQSDDLLQYQDTNNQDILSIRFLKVHHGNIIPYHACPDLRWLQLLGCPLNLNETKLFPKSLVILDISGSNFTESWDGWEQIKMLNALRVLKLTGCNHLVITPNFSGYPGLEMLILEKCCHLVRIDPSISHLKKLVHLNLSFCTELSTLPKELGSMKALKELIIDGSSVQEIPKSLGHIETLETLSASGCLSLNQLPASIGHLKSLLVLSLDHAEITEIPTAVKELVNLQKLSLRNCRLLRELPIAFGALGLPLHELDVSGTGIFELPHSIGNLCSLRVLKTESCFIAGFPLSILRLERLEEINASYCRSLSEFIRSYSDHDEIGRLGSLKILRLGFSRISRLPTNFCDLPSLETLDLRQCNMLRKLPSLPTSLTGLQYSCKEMEIPSLKLDNLEELILADGGTEELINQEAGFGEHSLQPDGPGKWASNLKDTLQWTHKSKLRTLDLRLSFLTSITLPCPPFASSLRKVVLSCVNLNNASIFSSPLVSLSLQQCWSLKCLKIRALKALEELYLDHTAIHEIIGLHKLEALKILKVSYCEVEHLEGLDKLTSLRSLTISHCDRLSKLPDISKLKMLSVLELQDGRTIDDIQGLK